MTSYSILENYWKLKKGDSNNSSCKRIILFVVRATLISSSMKEPSTMEYQDNNPGFAKLLVSKNLVFFPHNEEFSFSKCKDTRGNVSTVGYPAPSGTKK